MPSFESEKLQETLLDLLRSQEREKQLRDENAAILAGMSAMAGANSKRQVFNGLLSVLRKYIGFEHALVLTREDENAPLQELVTTCRFFESSTWPIGNTFVRSMNGESIALFAPNQVSEFQRLPQEMLQYCQSVLLTGVKVSSGDALLLFLHSERGQFSPRCRRVLERFRPLLERAIIDIDYRERLQSLVTARTQELIHSQQRFKDFAKTVGDWFWEVDTDLRFTYISSPNLANHVVDNDSILDIFDEQETLKKKLKVKFGMKEPFEDLEWQLPESEGGLWISFSGTPYFSKQGKLLGYRGTAKDITNRKKRLFELQEARKQAESANKAKSQFLAMMSHEIRTPLNAVLGFMDTLAESGLNKEQARWVNQMDQSAQLLLTIINDILDLSRIESGNFELYNAEMHLDESINLVVSQLHEQAVKKNIALSVNISPSVPKKMVGDKNRISQVMFNLIGNAIKFTNQGSVSIDVKRDNQYVSIAVTDTGIGISQEAQRNLFNPFIQADGSITRRYGGTGLGLAISQHLIDKMNGKITLESTLNKGSCFTVYIPITQSIDESQLYEPVIENSLDHSLSILLAEDSNTNQLVAKLMLEKRGHQVVIANNGKEAIEILENNQHQFDIVLMDISMPVLDGLQATKQLRQKNINIPIIALTANAMHSDQVEYRKAGMDGFLAKPILTPELNAMLNKYQALATTE
ncbi:hybrid sensor histidine kinase/response regulator [Photobacterium proteolyticum]|uniref:histidine kinase n=1 Tax=Photobacterium proteolyticum TaxID=1903952 RepID=A0A1Q9G709_9GAMM|nr:PAS domain-containing hybrid sensor histidine kinase/response regulator [Photobacterium proteolyticum]OLQ70019.1 hybrid sensor histidine kinase/response regulator [Photobacterium proteolyticum]